jgi:DNA-directed RNA polymerase specialized sigma subunit
MFNRKSDYALNKKDASAIVYIDSNGNIIRLTCEDFTSEDEFEKWKAWSDESYHTIEKCDHVHSNHTISIEGVTEGSVIAPAVETTLVLEQERQEREHLRVEQMAQIKAHLSETQFRRLWLYCVEGKNTHEIARLEQTSHQAISKSISGAIKKVFRFLGK